MGASMRLPPIDPSNGAPPKAKTPPSSATNQYPEPSGSAAIPLTGSFRGRPAIDPSNVASPKLNTPPSAPTSQ